MPVLVENKEAAHSSEGGAGLTYDQIHEFFPGTFDTAFFPGSFSTKERIFADGHLVARIDSDAESVKSDDEVRSNLATFFSRSRPEAIIISDYGKGAMTGRLIRYVLGFAEPWKIPVFVDAKNNWSEYDGAFAAFPNKKEIEQFPSLGSYYHHTILKLGDDGCRVDGTHIQQSRPHAVRDVTGAGDIFLASFVYHYLAKSKDLYACAEFANKVAGISVEHVGTYVVTRKELDKLGIL